MAQTINTARLTNTAVNIIGGTTSLTTNYGLTSIALAGNAFDISSPTTLTLGSTGSVSIGNTGAGAVTRFNSPITLGPAPTSSSHIGYISTISLNTQFMNDITLSANSLTIPSSGNWLISYAIRVFPNGTGGGTTVISRYYSSLLVKINNVNTANIAPNF
jgi:hypothetical protein